MKIKENIPAFSPVTITLETLEELQAVAAIFTYTYNAMSSVDWAEYFNDEQAREMAKLNEQLHAALASRI